MSSLINQISAGALMLGGTVGGMFRDAAINAPDMIALRMGTQSLSYRDLNAAVNRLANVMLAKGLSRGDRVAVLSENNISYVQIMLAGAKIGVITACLNWRQEPDLIRHCIQLTEPQIVFASKQFSNLLSAVDLGDSQRIELEGAFNDLLEHGSAEEPVAEVCSEDGLLILYTSGTTGRPKAPIISHRAMIARALLMRADWGIRRSDGFIAWSPLFHMASADPTIASLTQGSTVTVLPGFDPGGIAEALTQHDVGWMVLMPGMIERMADELERRNTPLKRVAAAGCMANLVPADQIVRISRLLNAPFLNSFGSTETGITPASGNWISPGEEPGDFGKIQNTGCEIKLLNENGEEVAPGETGEMCIRTPALFSGYWRDDDANAKAFEGGWYHMGDDFWRDTTGALHFADRRKYLIKSGGENIYPAEIEIVLRNLPGIEDAVVVRRPDPNWGEVPVAFIVTGNRDLSEADVIVALEGHVARFKLPKSIHFVSADAIERNSTGKILRDDLERRALELQAMEDAR